MGRERFFRKTSSLLDELLLLRAVYHEREFGKGTGVFGSGDRLFG